MSLHFSERPTLAPVFTNHKKSEFSLLPKEDKKQKSVPHVFCSKLLEHLGQQEWLRQAPFPRTALTFLPS